jgi:hypothetical protein
MKNIIRLGTIMIAASVLSAPVAFSQDTNGMAANSLERVRVPEIDAAGATLAFALMGGIVAIVRERRRRSR